jgi:hypothetical protein
MITVYLDQAKWIDLGLARVGKAAGARFSGALDVARQALSMGLVEFPLSNGHYIETWRASDPDRRRRLAQTMIELSRGRTLANPPVLCDNELDSLIAEVAERPPARPPWPPLGWGFPHASGAMHDMPRSAVDLKLETEFLATRPTGYLDHGRGHLDFAEAYKEGEAGLLSGGLADKSRSVQEDVVAVSAVVEIRENIIWALERAGLPPDALGSLGLAAENLGAEEGAKLVPELMSASRAFIAMLPTRDAALRLRLLRHQNPATKWEANDMVDIAYIACAVVHCDVVVTEKQWVHELKRSGLLKQHGTQAIHDVAELPSILVGAVEPGPP